MIIQDFNFGPASPNEKIVYGSRKPDFSRQAVDEWIQFMLECGIKRVCCLLDPSQLRSYSLDLSSVYERQFGKGNVCTEPIADYHLCEAATLHEKILPFLRQSDECARPSWCIVGAVTGEPAMFWQRG